LRTLLPADRKSVADDLLCGDLSSLTAKERGMIAFATKLTLHPASMSFADAEELRTLGLSDRGIVDLTQCIGYFAYANRVVAALGATLGNGEGTPGQ
jgi:uncharacterized peroxidase-related enzyme